MGSGTSVEQNQDDSAQKHAEVNSNATSDKENGNLDSIHDHLPVRTIDPPFILENHPVDDYLPIKAIVVGGGITGITAGILLPVKVPGLELTIYERFSDIVRLTRSNITC